MIETVNDKTTITCDKCKKTSSGPAKQSNTLFFSEGWGLYPNARKYQHLCRTCQPKKHQKAHDFVALKFKL